MSAHAPRVSVAIATRDRADSVIRAVDSILRCSEQDCEIVIADQSSDGKTLEALDRFSGDPRVRRIPVPAVGMAHARNAAISACRAECVAITDDDCEVDIHWLDRVLGAFASEPSVGIIFGNAVAAPFDAEKGFIPTYVREQRRIFRHARDKNEADGIGACMALRRKVWEELDGFDESFGVGGQFRAASEGDFAFRAMLRNWHVLEEPEVVVTHHGFRTWEQGQGLIQRYWFGAGAIYAKFLRLRWIIGAWLIFSVGYRWAFGSSRVASSLGARSHRWARLRAFLSGFRAGMFAPLDRRRGHFQVNAQAQSDTATTSIG